MRGCRLALLMTIVSASVWVVAQDPPPSANGAVSGFVRYANGMAIAGVRVSLIVRGESSAQTARTAADGSYRFDAVPAAEYQISASHPGVVARRVRLTAGVELKDIDFSIPDGSSRRVVTARAVMNAASRERPVPARIGVGVRWRDGTLAIPLAPGDQRVAVRLPEGYFLDSATYGSTTVYSLESVGGRRLSSATFAVTVPPEPRPIPELVITLGTFR